MSRPPLPTRAATYAGHGSRAIGRTTGSATRSTPRSDFVSYPILTLTREDAPLMTSFTKRGTREHDSRRRSEVFAVQSYIVRNDHSWQDRGENTIYGRRSASDTPALGAAFSNNSTNVVFSIGTPLPADMIPMYRTKLIKDGSILGYILSDTSDRALLKIHFHGNTKSVIDRMFKAYFRSPIPKWDVENHGLYRDVPVGSSLGMIRDVYPDRRIFQPAKGCQIPRLEMHNTGSHGTRYWLAITDIPEPVGQVESTAATRFASRREQYSLSLHHCTKEEALLWIMLIIATDMKRRKSSTVQSSRPSFSPVFL